MEKDRRLNIVLRPKDQGHIAAIQRDTGETTAVGAIRAALLKMAREADACGPRTNLVETLINVRDTARTGLPPAALNITQAQWDDHRLIAIARALTHLLDEL